MTQLQEQKQREERTSSYAKIPRILWGYLTQVKQGKPVTPKQYMDAWNVNSTQAWRDVKTIVYIERLLRFQFPIFRQLFEQQIDPKIFLEVGDLILSDTGESEVTVRFTVNHNKKRITWKPFKQILKRQGEEDLIIQYIAGSKDLT